MMIKRQALAMIAGIYLMLLTGCQPAAEKITPGKDNCAECKMSITDARFGAEIVTKKGRIHKFDDLHCLAVFLDNRREELSVIKQTLAVDYNHPEAFIPVSSAHLVLSSLLKTPMGGHAAAFRTKEDATRITSELPDSRITDWPTLYNVLVK